MDERGESEERQASGLSSRPLAYYVNAGAVLAVLRAALLVWADHYQGAAARLGVHWAFYPEALLFTQTPLGVMHFSRTVYYVVVSTVLAIGSYAIATPLRGLADAGIWTWQARGAGLPEHRNGPGHLAGGGIRVGESAGWDVRCGVPPLGALP